MVELSEQISKTIWVLIIGTVIHFIAFNDEIKVTNSYLKVQNTTLQDIANVTLLNKTGSLNESGWYPHPFKRYDHSDFYPVTAGFSPQTFIHYKQFEAHQVISGDHLIFFAYSDSGSYAGTVFLKVYNFKTNEVQTDEVVLLPWQMSYNKLNVQEAMKFNANKKFSKDGLTLNYRDQATTPDEPIKRTYQLKSEKLNFKAEFHFKLKKNTDSELNILRDMPKDEGFLLAQRIDDEAKYWMLGYKQYGIEVEGSLEYQKEKVSLSKANNSLMLIDYVGGLFTYKTHWLFCSANFVTKDGDKMAINFSDGISKTETNGAQESYFVLNGKVTLLEQIDYIYDLKTTEPWQLRTRDLKERNRRVHQDLVVANQSWDKVNFGLVKNTLVLNYGRFNGHITDENGKVHDIEDAKGLCEFNYVQW